MQWLPALVGMAILAGIVWYVRTRPPKDQR